MSDQIPITDDALKAALHSLRVEFAEWQLREFPLFGFDAIKQMGMRGLCSQAEADAAIKEAEGRVAADDADAPTGCADDALPGTAEDWRKGLRDSLSDEQPF